MEKYLIENAKTTIDETKSVKELIENSSSYWNDLFTPMFDTMEKCMKETASILWDAYLNTETNKEQDEKIISLYKECNGILYWINENRCPWES